MSDLLREQLLLRSEISDDGGGGADTPSRRSSQSPSSQRGEDGEQRGGGTYRSSIHITPATPPRPSAHPEEREEEEKEEQAESRERAGPEVGLSEFGGAVGGAKMDNLQQLIKQVIGGVLCCEVEKSFWTPFKFALVSNNVVKYYRDLVAERRN